MPGFSTDTGSAGREKTAPGLCWVFYAPEVCWAQAIQGEPQPWDGEAPAQEVAQVRSQGDVQGLHVQKRQGNRGQSGHKMSLTESRKANGSPFFPLLGQTGT